MGKLDKDALEAGAEEAGSIQRQLISALAYMRAAQAEKARAVVKSAYRDWQTLGDIIGWDS